MTVSNVSSATNPTQTLAASWYQQQFQDFNALANALQSGNLGNAQSAFSSWQQDLGSIAPSNLQSTMQSQPFGSNSKANSDYQALASALQSGDLAGAQQAFANLKQDVQGAAQTSRGHHHHHHHRAGTANNSNQPYNLLGGTSAGATTGSSDQTTGSTLNTQA